MIHFKLKNFRSINSAEIDIKGITVVSGENGCGKSTISRLLYNTFNIANNYETLIKDSLNSKLADLHSLIHSIMKDIAFGRYGQRISEENEWLYYSGRKHFAIQENEDIEDYLERIIATIDKIEKVIIDAIATQRSGNANGQRMYSQLLIQQSIIRLCSIFGITIDDGELNESDLAKAFEEIKKECASIIKQTSLAIDFRPLYFLNNELSLMFSQHIEDISLHVSEFNTAITNWDYNTLAQPLEVRKCVYIDTPMAIGKKNKTKNPYWIKLNDLLESKDVETSFWNNTNQINHTLNNDVLKGSTYFDDEKINPSFKYKRLDGKVFDLEECATGIKSFGILQILLENGHLNKNSLLIIDEPEAHLHPQWVVEYARLIVLLNKHLNVKVLIASHNPDMVSAIRYISEKEGILDQVGFYLAEKKDDDYTYDYTYLESDIEPIFASFNIALDRINQYGTITQE